MAPSRFPISASPSPLLGGFVAGLLLLVVVAACSGGGSDQIVVSAAASLTDAFADIEIAFEVAHPDTDVVLNFAGSATLREQILGGAPVDVFASANITIMDEVVAAGLADGSPVVFTRNALQIAVPIDNPGGIVGLVDFGRDDLLIGLCAEGVPCGVLARQALAAAGIVPAIDTNEPDVRALLTKVEVGELDAALVYATDIVDSDRVEGIETPNATADYSITVLTNPTDTTAARAFVDFVVSIAGQQILSDHGFVSP